MANYGRVKSTRIAPIGTIMPWGGGSSIGERPDNIPRGWIVCNASAQSLNAADYPLLAKVIGNTYGPFPDPTDTTSVIGTNYGIVNAFPYNPPPERDNHNSSRYVDQFALPNLNQVALVDIEPSRLPTDALFELGTYVSKNGTEGDLPDTEPDVDVDVTFTVEPSDNMAGRITGITMSDPIYNDTVYVLPRKMGIDHTPSHTHRPIVGEGGATADFDRFKGVQALAIPLAEFQPGKGQEAGEDGTTTIIAHGVRGGTTSPPHTFFRSEKDITWYDATDGGISAPILDTQVNIPFGNDLVPKPPSGKRTIEESDIYVDGSWEDDYSAVPNIQTPAWTGPFPPAGKYGGKRNFYPSEDIPPYHRGDNMPEAYINDPITPVGESQQVNLAVTNTFATTLNHTGDRWLDNSLKSHTHDAMELTMTKGSLAIPTTILVNNVSTGTTTPVNVDTALTIAVNPNSPSATIMYIIRAF